MNSSTPLHLVFMLEEKSAENFLDALLPKILPSNPSVTFKCISHRGKSDLQKSVPITLKAWRRPNDIFVILHDLDNHTNCKALKNKLQLLCANARVQPPLIRIVCRELEAWYLGDLDAVEKVFPRFKADLYKNKRKYQNPDTIAKPSTELKNIIKSFRKSHAAREMPKYMIIANNTSPSFRCLIAGIQNLVAAHNPQQNCSR